MEDYLDQKFSEGLRRLAREGSSDEVPRAADVWSRSQFRLRYHSPKRRHRHASTVSMAMAASYLLLFLLWNLGPESLKIGISLWIAVGVISAFLLTWMIRRTVRG
jgi:hypothetical protein